MYWWQLHASVLRFYRRIAQVGVGYELSIDIFTSRILSASKSILPLIQNLIFYTTCQRITSHDFLVHFTNNRFRISVEEPFSRCGVVDMKDTRNFTFRSSLWLNAVATDSDAYALFDVSCSFKFDYMEYYKPV